MFKVAIAFLLGIYSLTVFASLPHWYWAFGILPTVLIWIKFPRSILPVSLLLGFFWALTHAYFNLYPELDKSIEGIDIEVRGQVISIPSVQGRISRFEFSIHEASLTSSGKFVQPPKKVRLNWYGKVPSIQLGEVWRLRVRLKRPWGYANPGGFDYEKWLFEQSIRATGYVRNKGENERIRGTSLLNPAYYLRATLNQKLEQTKSKSSAVIKALVLGERGQMDSKRWQVLTQTGTNHLLAISGLHVGIVSGFVYFIVLFLWKRSEHLCLKIAAQRVAALAAIFAAVFYAMLAGFSIPTQRAMMMATVVFLSIYFMQSLRPWNILSIALLCVLVLDPFSVLSPGFWLSFLAVAIILFSLKGKSTEQNKQAKQANRTKQAWWRSLVKIQFVLSLGLLPLTLLFFQQASLVSPIANFFAVPWVSFLVVPVTLMGSLLMLASDTLGGWVLQISHFLLEVFWSILNYLHALPFSSWHHAIEIWALVPALVGIMLLLSAKGFPSKWLSVILLSPLVFAKPAAVSENNLTVTTLDVGQGLSVVIEVGEHVLVFDTGPKFSSSFNAGESVVIPYLRQRGIDKIDTLVVSHGDKDHAGGLQGILLNMPVEKLLSSNIENYHHDQLKVCRAGVDWQWHSAHFQFIHPPANLTEVGLRKLSDNNSSCVLLVTHPSGSILLTGDIEKLVEKRLIANQHDKLDIDVLIAPHHGSKSSSTRAFIQTTSPDYVVFATGYRNPYGFPDENVVSRYEEFGSHLVNTASQGMISFEFSDENGLQLQPGYREVRQRFWHSKI
jgi:competence protein ComEC